MKVPFNDLTFQNQSIQSKIEEQFKKCLEESVYIGGKALSDFENSFARYLDVKHCIGTGNCTDALELILEAMDIGYNDEVIVPAYTWVSTASCVVRSGAIPVFVDIDPNYYTIDTELIEASITNKTKAIIAVHFYGLPAEMEPLKIIGKKYGIRIIEDCAQAAGAEYKNRKVGSWGDAAAFSFYPTKNLGSLGDGGCVTTNDQKLAKKIRTINNHGQFGKNKHKLVGRNSRLDTLQASILSLKLEYLDKWNQNRLEVAEKYKKRLNGNMVKLQVSPPYSKHVYHLFVIQIEGNYLVQGYLENKGITTFVHYPLPLPELLPFEKFKRKGDCFSVSKRMASRILSLPIFPGISDQQIDYVCENLIEAISFGG